MRREFGLLALFLGIVMCAFFLGRNLNMREVQMHKRNVDKFTRANDSLNKCLQVLQDSIANFYVKIDTVAVVKSNNHKKLNNDVKTLKNISDSNRKHYLDSLYSAAQR